MKNLTFTAVTALVVLLVMQGCTKEALNNKNAIIDETEFGTVQSDTVTAKSDITASTSDTVQLVPITNDVIIAVSFYRNTAGDKVMINFMPYVSLNNNYCRNAILQFKSAVTADNNFNLHLVNVRQSKGCAIATAPTTSVNANTAAYDVFVNKLLGFGTYPLKITVGSVVYNGSIVVSASNITFNWTYTSGVIFPTKVIPNNL